MGRVTVVLADDDLEILDAFQKCFHHLADIHLACDGESALELIESGIRPAVMVCDYRMPDINGVDVVKRAREMTGAEIPAIIASGDTSAQTIKAAKLARCTVLKKPYTPEALIKLIARVNLDRWQDEQD
ncbi:MAG: response regulator [Burkholderiales bacterium]|nr:response regulator [Burkholderiales bacterium]